MSRSPRSRALAARRWEAPLWLGISLSHSKNRCWRSSRAMGWLTSSCRDWAAGSPSVCMIFSAARHIPCCRSNGGGQANFRNRCAAERSESQPAVFPQGRSTNHSTAWAQQLARDVSASETSPHHYRGIGVHSRVEGMTLMTDGGSHRAGVIAERRQRSSFPPSRIILF